MTLSYSLGLTGGSAVAYLLDSWLGPMVEPCGPLNGTTPHYNQTTNSLPDLTTFSTVVTTMMPSTTSTITSELPTTLADSTLVTSTVESMTTMISTVGTYVVTSLVGNDTVTSLVSDVMNKSSINDTS